MGSGFRVLIVTSLASRVVSAVTVATMTNTMITPTVTLTANLFPITVLIASATSSNFYWSTFSGLSKEP